MRLISESLLALFAVDGDPVQDITVFQKIALVIKQGEVYVP
ncbi:hypothetical protein PS2015_1192 [Pseudohongiella spirulinae]|uniref:Uncharacterized protein n=1 Tax=Pseudohongiella spirulinae TaxID=1249552 RepID=A0A0S2KC13_9GAMM|nr:hypothetical protein PS2015_1192 [Pseudohongiella spirulinae]